MPGFGFILKQAARISGLILVTLLAILLVLGLLPVNTGGLRRSEAHPAASYAESAEMIQAVIDDERGKVCDICGTLFYTHGEKTAKAVVLIHGLTNSPRQFQELGEQLYDAGYNVLIPRLPYHGLTSHTVSELGNTTTEDLRLFADDTVDMAAGLGDELTVAGLSGGGTVTGWIVQNRAGVDKAVLMAPLYGLSGVPGDLNTWLGNLFYRLPNINVTSSSEPPRESVYLGWSSKGVAEYLVFSRAARPEDAGQPAMVNNLVLVTNGNDHTVNNGMSEEVVGSWEAAGARVTRYQFDESLGLPHDIVDMTSVGDRSQEVYPVLLTLIESD